MLNFNVSSLISLTITFQNEIEEVIMYWHYLHLYFIQKISNLFLGFNFRSAQGCWIKRSLGSNFFLVLKGRWFELCSKTMLF